MKDLIKKLLRENIQQAEKLYFNTGKIPPAIKEKILAITHGDVFTRSIADFLVWLGSFSPIKESEIAMANGFYNNLKNYNKAIFPVKKDLLFYNEKNDTPYHVSDLYSLLYERNFVINKFNKLPSLAQRNLGYLKSTPYESEYQFKEINKKVQELAGHLEMIPNTPKGEIVLKKIYAKKDLDKMNEIAEHYSLAFAPQSGEDIETLLDAVTMVDANIIQNSNNIIVIQVNDYEAMKRIGCTSAWCFSQPRAQHYWDDYAEWGFVFVIFDFNKDPEDATYMMTLLPDQNEVYASSNVILQDLGIKDSILYLKRIGVDFKKIDAIDALSFKREEPEEPETKKPFVDPNQLSLFESLRRKILKEYKNLNDFFSYAASVRSKGAGYDLDLNQINDNLITIERIDVPKNIRGGGEGTEIINHLKMLSDKHNVVLQLIPGPSSTLSRKFLINYYTKRGFKLNAKLDYPSKDDSYLLMYREPNKLNEEVLTEIAATVNDLPQGTGIYVSQNRTSNITLYNSLESKVYAMINFYSAIDKMMTVAGVAAEKGLGPLIYEIAMTFIYPDYLMPSRFGNIKPEAFMVWEKFFRRNDINTLTLPIESPDFEFTTLDPDLTITDPVKKKQYFESLNDVDKHKLTIFNTGFQYKSPDFKKYKDLVSVAKNSEKSGNKSAAVYAASFDYFKKKYV